MLKEQLLCGHILLKLISAGGPFGLWMGHLRNKGTFGYLVNWWQYGEAVGGITGSCEQFNPNKTGAWPASNNQVTTCACKPCYWLCLNRRRGGLAIMHCQCSALVLPLTSLTLFWLCTPAHWIWNETLTIRLKCQLSTLIWGCASLEVFMQFKSMLSWIEVRWLN